MKSSPQMALVSEITNFSTRDGPGIRTSVFLKGCPLRCKWCSNPETFEKKQMLFFMASRCRQCGACALTCPQKAIRLGQSSVFRIDRKKCDSCMKCVDACLYNALQMSGEWFTTDQLMHVIERDKCFYGTDGGVTISGGEPLMSGKFVLEIFQRCKEQNIGTVLDTTGYGDSDLLHEILRYTDLVLLDIKQMDPVLHKKWTGVSNELIHQNAEIITSSVETRISLPLVGGVNDTAENLHATAKFAVSHGIKHIDINPLHTLGAGKYHYLGKRSPYRQFHTLEKPELDEVAEIFHSYGLQVSFGRMM